MVTTNDILLLNQLIETSEASLEKIKELEIKERPEDLAKLKKLILQTQKEILKFTNEK